jgi:hypothetical protein
MSAPIAKHELGGNACLVRLQGNVGPQCHGQVPRPEDDTACSDFVHVLVPGVIERGVTADAVVDLAFDGLHSSHQRAIFTGAATAKNRHEVGDLTDAVVGEETGDQKVRIRPIELLRHYAGIRCADLKPTALFIVKQRCEDAGRIKAGITHPINGPIPPHQRGSVHIPDQSVRFNGQISHSSFS